MESLKKFKQFVDEINLENGRNYKISVLEQYKNDEDIKYYLNYIFNPYIVTGISDKKLHKPVFPSGGIISFVSKGMYKSVLDYIANHNTGTDETLYFYHSHADHLESELRELLDKIVTKNVILGIDAKTINKVIPGLIPTFNVMLSNKYFSKPEVIEGKEFAITTKIDGMRCIMLKENDKVTFWSRQGKQIEGLVDLEQEAEKYFPDNICLDGELVAIKEDPDTYKETMKTATTKSLEKHGLKMKVFDCMMVEDFKNQSCDVEYWERRAHLSMIFNGIKSQEHNGFVYFELLPILYRGKDTSQIEKILKEQVAMGNEGIMLNDINAKYEFKRTNSLLKCKLFDDCELEVIDFEPGINKFANTLGALVCNYKGNRLGVGTGFTDEERDYIWSHKEDFLGKFVKVQYFEETVNAAGEKSLRFPIYLGMRLIEDI